MSGVSVSSFAEVEQWLRGLPDQMVGIPTAVCQTGEPYLEFYEAALARPTDAKVIEGEVASRMKQRLFEYFSDRRGMIYWRIPFEYKHNPYQTIVRFDEAGPDVDFISNRKCVLDHDWLKVACYCRVYRARQGFSGFDFAVTATPKQPTSEAA